MGKCGPSRANFPNDQGLLVYINRDDIYIYGTAPVSRARGHRVTQSRGTDCTVQSADR